MKAIFLCSGVGSRLMPLTKDIPKSLIEVNGRTILEIELEGLVACDIKDIIITTGYLGDALRRYVRSRYPSLDIHFVQNPLFGTTNYIYSLWLTAKFVDTDVLIMHGDIVFEKILLKRLMEYPFPNGALIKGGVYSSEKDFKALVRNERVKKIGVDLRGKDAFFCAPIYKFSKSCFSRWLSEIETFIDSGRRTCYAEDALNEILDEIVLKPVFFDKEFCMEIDTPEDLKIAEAHYNEVGG